MDGIFENDPGYLYLEVSRDEKVAYAAMPFDSKKNCWVPDPDEGYIGAEIKALKDGQVTVVTKKGNELTFKNDQAQEMNPPKYTKTEDMANLTFLNEASVLHNLKSRYYSMMIYTYSGLFCVVINPYKRLPIYSESIIKHYMGKRRTEMPPHLFAVADEAYRNMKINQQNQSMLITGESGAGKTENTKKVIAYLALVGGNQPSTDSRTNNNQATLEEQIVQTNPVLEAFGNAKTLRNNNSSRFGKFIRSHFSTSGKLAGGDIDHYLLEKSRVVKQARGERGYHIFYQIMSGWNCKLKEKLQLTNSLTYYHFISQAELTIEGIDDKEEMGITQHAFDIMGFDGMECMNLYKNVAGIMHMGEMKFKQRPREEQAEIDGCEDAKNAACCFGIDYEAFVKALLKPRVRVGNEWVNKGQNLEQVHCSVAGLAKAIYSQMFHWLISRCNKTLDQRAIERKYFIGVLDIAGFEIFDFNSFEQLWINFVNEKLQQFFNHHMFILEQEEYRREKIEWTFIDFGLDLQATIDLIEKPLGIISMLDEECIVPRATDMTYVQKLLDQHLGKHPNFQKPKPPKGKQSEAHISIVHYAGTVQYNVNNFLEKNKDPLNDSAVTVLKSSKDNQLMLEIWDNYLTQEDTAELAKRGKETKRGGKAASFMTASMLYRESLNNLMNMLNQTHPHFIRCIIPNEKKASGVIDSWLVMNQLTCNGVLEGIRICRKGFPNRMIYSDFKHRYSILEPSVTKTLEPKQASIAITEKLCGEKHLDDEEYRFGETKIFFKAGVLARLEDLRDEKLSKVMAQFQAQIRGFLIQNDLKRRIQQQKSMLVLQRNIRSWSTVRTWEWFKLFSKVKPLLKTAKQAEEIEKLGVKIKEMEADLVKEEEQRKELEVQVTNLKREKDELFAQLEEEKTQLVKSEENVEHLEELKKHLNRKLEELSDRLDEMENRNSELQRSKTRAEQEIEKMKKNFQELEADLRVAEAAKASFEGNVRALQDEMKQQDEIMAKLNQEKKNLENSNQKLTKSLFSEEEKVQNLNKLKAKLEEQLDALDEYVNSEKRNKQELEKIKRKLEGELKIAQENVDELAKQKHGMEQTFKQKDNEMNALVLKLEEEQSTMNKFQKQVKELQSCLNEKDDELELERHAHSKSERARAELEKEIEEVHEKLEEANGMITAQNEINKKREMEMAKLRRDLEQTHMNHENQMVAIKKKNGDTVAELEQQLGHLQKCRLKSESEKKQMQKELEEANYQMEQELKTRQEAENLAKLAELQRAELQSKVDEQERILADMTLLKSRLTSQNSEMEHALEDMESQLQHLHRAKSQLTAQYEEAKRDSEAERRENQSLMSQFKSMQHENENLRQHLHEEQETKSDNLRQISKLNAEIQQWKAKFETESLAKMDEIEQAKRKLQQKVQELTETNEMANSKVSSLEKVRQKLLCELDDAQIEMERSAAYASSLEKKHHGFDRIIDEWKKKCDDLNNELDSVQKEARNMAAEFFKTKATNEELIETIEGTRRENRNLAQELKEVTEQLNDGANSVHELNKIIRKYEVEKEELKHALDRAEVALEAEENKAIRAQAEISEIHAEIEKRIQDKDEEIEVMRKNSQRAIESMQATLEAEIKGKTEMLRVKKKLESDINDLEIALDHANKAYADAQRNLKRQHDQIKELQTQVEEEQKQKLDLGEQLINGEKRFAYLHNEKSDLCNQFEQIEKARRAAEAEVYELRNVNNELSAQLNSLNMIKKRVECELQAVHTELDETLIELKNTDEHAKKTATDAARLAEELRQEQEHTQHVERLKKSLEAQIKDMQSRLDDAEGIALKGGRKVIGKLEERIRALEQELEMEQRRHQEAQKVNVRVDRRVKELEFQVEENKKNGDNMTELVDKLQKKLRVYKKQADEAEEIAATNLGKYRQLQIQLGEAEERADIAENCLSKIRTRERSAFSVAPGNGKSDSSASAIVMRTGSFARNLD